jgi:hypothetical protein
LSLDSGVTKTANHAPAAVDYHLDRYTELVITLKITAAERDTGNETYDFYVITGNGLSEWDLVHFPQVASTGAKTFTARLRSDMLPQNVTTASPGVAANESGTISTASGGAETPKTLAAGTVRHGPWGNMLRYELVVAGTIVTGISYSLQVQARQ